VKFEGVTIEETFAEAFGMQATRLHVTAPTPHWAMIAAQSAVGFATSVIGCGLEAGIERRLEASETIDGRPGVSLLLFAVSKEALAKAVRDRVGQAILTCPGTACFAGLAGEAHLPLGRALRYFGDGHQRAKRVGARRFWRIPVMDGEFVCEDRVGYCDAVGGGNFLMLGRNRDGVLAAAERAIAAMQKVTGVIMPFPGGIVRSGSKVGSKYRGLIASTNDPYCPTLKGVGPSELTGEEGAVLEIVIDGMSEAEVARAMVVGIRAACAGGVHDGLTRITAGNYGGKLGAFHFRLHEILA